MKKNSKKPKLRKYPNGGLNKFGNALEDIGYGAADMTLSGLGAGNYIDSQYNTETGQKFNQGLNQAQPLITGISDMIPIWGQVAKAGRGIGSQYNPEYEGTDQEQLQKQQMYAMGGMSNMPNAELENQEVFKTPNGQINAVNGPSHEQGGVPVNIPNKTLILSDKLKMNGKTFAKLGAKYTTSKEDKIMSDDKADKTSKATAKLTSEIKQKKLDQLFSAQESMKKDKMASYAKKLGIEMPMKHQMPDGSMMNNSEMYRNGGLKRDEDYGSKNKPYPSVKSSDFAGGGRSYPIPTKEDAIDALRLAGLHGRSDIRSKVYSKYPSLKKYQEGGTYDENGVLIAGPMGSTLNNETSIPSITNQDLYNRNQLNSINNVSLNKMEYIPNKYDPYEQAMSSGNEFTKKSTPQQEGDYQNNISNLAGLASLAGPITGLATNKPQAPVNYTSASYIPMSDKAELRANANTAAWNRRMLKGASQGSSYLPNAAAISSAAREADANTVSKYANINTQGYNRAAEARADAANKSMDATAQDRARTRDLNTKYIGDIGTGVAKLARDEKATQQDYKTLGMISSLYPNYKYNQRTGEWRHKSSNVLLSEEDKAKATRNV